MNEPSGFETVDPAPDDEPADYKQARIWYLIVNGLAFAAFIGGLSGRTTIKQSFGQ